MHIYCHRASQFNRSLVSLKTSSEGWNVQVRAFGSLVKGLRNGMELLLLLLKEGQLTSSLSKIFELPELHGSDGLDKFLVQFEAAVDSEFPNYQVCFFTNLFYMLTIFFFQFFFFQF